MRFQEIAGAVKRGEIKFDCQGHLISQNFRDAFLDRYQDIVECAAGKHDNEWQPGQNETMEQLNVKMRKFYQRDLDWIIDQGWGSPHLFIEQCFGCSSRLQWVLQGDTLRLSKDVWGQEIPPCPYAIPRPTSGQIQVRSRLLFANFFREFEDAPPGERYHDEWSLNYLIGRENITRYKSQQFNVAYGQMGNTSIGIFVHPNQQSIIVGNPYREEDTTEVIEEHLLVGQICLDVWRWEATDLLTLGIDKYEDFAKGHRSRGLVEVNVPHGIWEFQCWEFQHNKEDVYARLTLRKHDA